MKVYPFSFALLLCGCAAGVKSDLCGTNPVDIIFMLDQSDSITVAGFDSIKAFTSSIVSRFDISKRTTRAGLLKYSDMDRPSFEFFLGTYDNRVELLDAIDTAAFEGGSSAKTHVALKSTRELMYDVAFGGRKNAVQIAILVTDSESASRSATRTQADLLKDAYPNVNVFSIGITNKVLEREMQAIASEPDDYFFHPVPTFKELSSAAGPVGDKVCDVAGTSTTSTSAPICGSTTDATSTQPSDETSSSRPTTTDATSTQPSDETSSSRPTTTDATSTQPSDETSS
eukprot:Selendium_serpulae@DN6129_c1_g1_i3.p1